MSNEKIHGLYKGTLDNYKVDYSQEFSVYSHICAIEEYLNVLNGSKKENILYDANYVHELEYAKEYLMYHTRNFGVKFFDEPSKCKKLYPTIDYLKWYQYWKDFEDDLYEEDFYLLYYKLVEGEDISQLIEPSPWKVEYENSKKIVNIKFVEKE